MLDPFGGTGTTAKAAAKLGRRFATFEMDVKYADLIKKYFVNASVGNDLNINWINITVSEEETRNLFSDSWGNL